MKPMYNILLQHFTDFFKADVLVENHLGNVVPRQPTQNNSVTLRNTLWYMMKCTLRSALITWILFLPDAAKLKAHAAVAWKNWRSPPIYFDDFHNMWHSVWDGNTRISF